MKNRKLNIQTDKGEIIIAMPKAIADTMTVPLAELLSDKGYKISLVTIGGLDISAFFTDCEHDNQKVQAKA